MRRYGGDRRFALPLILILIGLLFLVGNFGLFDRLALWRLGDLWPLLLVLIGGLIIINRVLAPQPAQLASLALVALLIIVSAAYVLAYPVTAGGSIDLRGSLGSLAKAQLNLDFGADTVNVSAPSLGDDLYQAHFEYSPGEPVPTANLDREKGVLSIEQNAHFNPFGVAGPHHDRLAIKVNGRIPWTVRISGGASQLTVDLGQGHLAGLRIEGGASKMDVTLPAAQGSVRVEISGGAGRMNLRAASGSVARITVTGGVGTLDVNGSRQTGIGRVEWETPGFSSASDRYDIEITGGASNVTLDTR